MYPSFAASTPEGKCAKHVRAKKIQAYLDARDAERQQKLVRREEKLWTSTSKRLGLTSAKPDGWSSHQPIYLPTDSRPLTNNSQQEWSALHFDVGDAAKPSSWLVADSELIPLFGPLHACPHDVEQLDGEALWATHRADYASDLEAIARAVWQANRLVKINAERHEKTTFYGLKDHWLRRWQLFLTEGRIARVETRVCWGCDGSGEGPWGDCGRCDGTGVYGVSRTLYEHHLTIEGRPYCFHSYVKPSQVVDTPGADMGDYGHRFDDGEYPKLNLQQLIALLRHISDAPTASEELPVEVATS